MVKIRKGKSVMYNNIQYKMVKIKHKLVNKYLLLDAEIYTKLKKLELKWYFNDKGILFHLKKDHENKSEIYLHDLIYTLSGLNPDIENKTFFHKNRIYLDNRLCNLGLRNNPKLNKNMAKKTRTVELPKTCKINKNDFPTYLWYVHPNGNHGSRFFLKMANISWKSTSSKKFSDEYKFEESKKYMRTIFKKNPEIFSVHSMNGDYNEDGKMLVKEYLEIIGDDNITEKKINKMFGNTTKVLLKENTKYLSSIEKNLLKNFGQDSVPKLLKRLLK